MIQKKSGGEKHTDWCEKHEVFQLFVQAKVLQGGSAKMARKLQNKILRGGGVATPK